MKTDCDGNMLWAKKDSVDFLGENDNYAVVETDEGSLISVGYCFFGGGYMIKRDSEGNRLWAIPYDDFGANSMCKTNDGNIILGGVVQSEIALRKLDINGNTIWTQSHNCGYTSIAQSITQISDDGFVLTGLASGNGYDIIVMKTDENGDSLWTRTFDGYGDNDYGNCVIETDDENYISVGRVRNAKSYYGIIIKLDTLGDTLWTKIFDDGLLHWIGSVVQTQDNNYVLQGGKLVKIDDAQNVIWEEPLIGQIFGRGDRNLQETSDGEFICTSVINWGDYIVLNKTNSLGQITAVDEYDIPSDNITVISYPNPFSSSAIISFFNLKNTQIQSFSLTGHAKDINIQIYNIKGQVVRDLGLIHKGLGTYETIWDGRDRNDNVISNGIYFLKLENREFNIVKKIIKIGD